MTNTTDTAPSAKPETPELDRQLELVQSGQSVLVQGFIDWLGKNGMVIMTRCLPQYDGDYECLHDTTGRYCGRCANTGYRNSRYDFEQLMADFFEIDRDKIERERRALLSWLQTHP